MTETRLAERLTPLGLVVLLIGQILPALDFSIVNVALDEIARALQTTHTQMELVVAVYGVGYAVCLALGGRLGDNYGRKTIYIAGVVLFALASLICGVAPSLSWLLLGRVLQGVAAALMTPQILATIHVSLHGTAHSRALGLFGSIGGLAFVAGQVLGGFLVDIDLWHLGWRAIFLVNLPFCALALILAPGVVPQTRNDHPQRVDKLGTVLLALLITALLVPLALGPARHWPLWSIAMLIAVLPLAAALIAWEFHTERKGAQALIPPTLFNIPSIRFGAVLALLFYSCWSGFMFVVALALQVGAEFTARESGNAFVFLGMSYFVGCIFSTRVVQRIGSVRTLLLGCAIQMPSLLWLGYSLAQHWPHPVWSDIYPATAVIGFGQAFIVSNYYRIGLSDLNRHQAGAGASLLSTLQQGAFGLGTAVLGAVFVMALKQAPDDYLHALHYALYAEVILMLGVVVAALRFYRHYR